MEQKQNKSPSALEGLLAEKHKAMIDTEWAAVFNAPLGLDPAKIKCSSTKQVYWRCQRCGSLYRMSPKERTRKAFRDQEPCFYCRGRRQKHPFTV